MADGGISIVYLLVLGAEDEVASEDDICMAGLLRDEIGFTVEMASDFLSEEGEQFFWGSPLMT